MFLSEQDRGRTVEVGAGGLVTVRLKENPTTGYRWQLASAGGLELANDRFEPGNAIGAGGVRVLEFRAASPGSHAIRMKNYAPWEGESSAIDSFEATIVVK